MLNGDIVKDLRAELKELGYNRNMVSIRNGDYGISVIIKDESVDYATVKRIIDGFNSRSIVVDYDESLKNDLAEKLKEYSETVFNTKNEDNCLNMFFENDNYKLFYNYKDEQMIVEDKHANCSYPKMIDKFNVHTATDLKYCLMRVCLRYKINILDK